jgi:hypothetical protein
MANKILGGLMKSFLKTDMERRVGEGDPQKMALLDREKEGRLMAGLLGPAAPLATVPVIGAGAVYEGVKAAAQKTGLGKYLPGPFKVGKNTSKASGYNVAALAKGFSEQAMANVGLKGKGGGGLEKEMMEKKKFHDKQMKGFIGRQILEEMQKKTDPHYGTDLEI